MTFNVRTKTGFASVLALLGAVVLFLFPSPAMAHCDGLDGPVVKAAEKALAGEDVNLVLIWVEKRDEEELRDAFYRTLAVRKLGPQARELADFYFFETLVRLHRAGEGAPYTGLQPAGRDLGPAIPLADEALTTGNVAPLVKILTDQTLEGLTERFERVLKTKNYRNADVGAGREYVRAYVAFVEYVERAYEAANQPVIGHFPENHPLEGGW